MGCWEWDVVGVGGDSGGGGCERFFSFFMSNVCGSSELFPFLLV